MADKEILPSACEQNVELAKLTPKMGYFPKDDVSWVRKPCIVTYRCDCGAEKVERI